MRYIFTNEFAGPRTCEILLNRRFLLANFFYTKSTYAIYARVCLRYLQYIYSDEVAIITRQELFKEKGSRSPDNNTVQMAIRTRPLRTFSVFDGFTFSPNNAQRNIAFTPNQIFGNGHRFHVFGTRSIAVWIFRANKICPSTWRVVFRV